MTNSEELTELLFVKSKLVQDINTNVKLLNLIQHDVSLCQNKLDTMRFMAALGEVN